MTVMEAFYVRIVGDADITARVANRIYRGFRPQVTGLPCITFTRVDREAVQGSTGRTGTERLRVQVDIWCEADHDREAEAIAEALKARLDGWTNESSPAISSCFLDSEYGNIEDEGGGATVPLSRVTQDYGVWYSAS